MLQVTISRDDRSGGLITVNMAGRLDALSAETFVQAVLPVLTQRCTVVLDMAGVCDVTHAGLVALFRVALAASGLYGDDTADNQAAFYRLLRADYGGITPLHLVAPRWQVIAQIQSGGLGAIAVIHNSWGDWQGTLRRGIPCRQLAA